MNDKRFFHAGLDVTGRACLVVGGDGEALDKAERLIDCGARLTVVSPKLIPELKTLLARSGSRHVARLWQAGDESGMFLVVNAVKSDPNLSSALYALCCEQHILIASYDQPEQSNVVMSGLFQAGNIQICISTNGAIPAIARKLRIEFEQLFDLEFAAFSEWSAHLRQRMVDEGISPEVRRERLRELMEDFRIEGKLVYPEEFRKETERGN